MNPLIAALLAAGVISADEARVMNGLLNESATRVEAEQRIAAAFAAGLENQRSRLITALDRGNVDYRDPMLPDFWRGEHAALARDVLPTLSAVAQDVGLTATVRGGGLAQWRAVNEAVIAWTDTHYRSAAGDAIGSIPNLDETARNQVADAVQAWQRGELNAGTGRTGLPRLIAELQTVDAFDADRAARIAVTETTRIYAEAERTAAQANPNMVYMVWHTSSDEFVCPICGPLEGQRIEKGATSFPGGYYPPAHVNCRCGVSAVTEYAAAAMGGVASAAAPAAPAAPVKQWQPAASKEEAAQRFAAYVKTYELGDLPLPIQNDILRGVEDMGDRYNISLNRMGYVAKKSKGLNAHAMSYGKGRYEIEFQKTYVRNAAKQAEEAAKAYTTLRTNKIEYYKRALADPARSNFADYNQKKLEHWQSQSRWSVSSSANINSLEATTRHELYHVLDYMDGQSLRRRVVDALNQRGLSSATISEYGSSSAAETFAELGAWIDMDEDVPQSFIDAFLETIKK